MEDKTEFHVEFLRCLKYAMIIYTREPAVENVIDFVTKFAASFETAVNEETEEEEEDDDDDDDDNKFLNFLFNFLLEVVSLMCRHLDCGEIILHCVPFVYIRFLIHLFLSLSLMVRTAMRCGFVFVSW